MNTNSMYIAKRPCVKLLAKYVACPACVLSVSNFTIYFVTIHMTQACMCQYTYTLLYRAITVQS